MVPVLEWLVMRVDLSRTSVTKFPVFKATVCMIFSPVFSESCWNVRRMGGANYGLSCVLPKEIYRSLTPSDSGCDLMWRVVTEVIKFQGGR